MSEQQEKRKDHETTGTKDSPREPRFLHIVTMLMTQALVDLGQLPNPLNENKPKKDLNGAKYTIDLLGILQDKTKGNLTEEEQRVLSSTLADLRLLYVQAVNK